MMKFFVVFSSPIIVLFFCVWFFFSVKSSASISDSLEFMSTSSLSEDNFKINLSHYFCIKEQDLLGISKNTYKILAFFLITDLSMQFFIIKQIIKNETINEINMMCIFSISEKLSNIYDKSEAFSFYRAP